MPVLKVEVTKYQCGRCGHEWFPRNLESPGKLPRACTKCHNAYWNEPRVYKTSTDKSIDKTKDNSIKN